MTVQKCGVVYMKLENSIFNAEQKQMYIDKINNESGRDESRELINYFKRISKKEKSYGRDIADMECHELRDTVSSMETSRELSGGRVLDMLHDYMDWTVKTGRGGKDALLFMEHMELENMASPETIRNEMIRDPEHMLSILVSERENISEKDKVVYLALYYGAKKKNLGLTEEHSFLGKTKISIDNIIMSGLFFKLLSFEDEEEKDIPKKIGEIMDIKSCNRPDLLAKTKKIRSDYEVWKKAFGHK